MSKKKFDQDVLRRLLRYTRPYSLFLALAMISALVSVVLTLFIPVLIGDAVDCAMPPARSISPLWRRPSSSSAAPS